MSQRRTPLSKKERARLLDQENQWMTAAALSILFGCCGGTAIIANFQLSFPGFAGCLLVAAGIAGFRWCRRRMAAIDAIFEEHGGSLEERAYGDWDGPDVF